MIAELGNQNDATWKLASDVALVSVPDGSARLLDMNGDFHAVSATGARMLDAVLEHGEAMAAMEIAREFGVEPVQVQGDLAAFLGELQTKGLLCKIAAQFQPKRWPGWILLPCLWVVCHTPLRWLRLFSLLGLAKLSFHCFGWSATLAAWGRFAPKWKKATDHESWRRQAEMIDTHVRSAAAGHVLQMECKERALACWFLARRAGYEANLVVGIQFYPLAGHCWCESGEWLLSDSKENCGLYTPMMRS
jgi:hypothetical protein